MTQKLKSNQKHYWNTLRIVEFPRQNILFHGTFETISEYNVFNQLNTN